ncbi:MAG: WecB/TagA/CpsF family glycosyltransferase [Lentisphaerae bacterium]|nr:WecB/TagA/CpsF family glycosyltransferase [Lentisphaerota bacterium]
MKILLSAIPFDNGKSGISVYIREVVNALERAGHDLTLIVEDDGAKEFERFELIRIKKRRALFSMLYSLFILPWRINWKKFDFCIMLAANRRVFCRYPIFTIAVVHDLSQYHVPVKYDKFRMLYIKKVLPHYVRKAQSIVAISHSTKNDLINYWHIPEEKITVVYNGFTPPENVEAKKKKQILYVSRIEHPGKNHLNLLKAFELLPEELRREYTLVMPGAAWNGAETVFEYAKNSPYADQFKFTGFVDFAKLPELYAQSSMYIFPSHFEGFGLSLLEAMHAGLPCACSNNSSLGELGRGAAELFDPASPQEIAASMRKILSDPGYQQELIEKGRQNAARFSWQNTASGLIDLYRKRTANVFGVPFFTGTMKESLQKIENLVQTGKAHHVAFINAHCLNIAYKDAAYKQVLKECSAVFSDGIGAKIGAKVLGYQVEENVNGTDMFPLLAQMPFRIYLFGGSPAVAKAALEKARARVINGKAEFIGSADGFFQEKKEEELFAELTELKPDLLLVAMGVPKQEMWIHEHLQDLPGCTAIGVGGLLDFVSERIPRAPQWMRKSGLEWCFRLYCEPIRLFKRYIIGNPLFIWRVFQSKFWRNK